MGGILTASNILGKNLLAKIAASPGRAEDAVAGKKRSSADRMPSAA
jgi:hypothetical protein